MRTEQEIFDELATVCATPGYAHVAALLCFGHNIVGYKDELKGEDYSKLFSKDRLIRTEISTLVGLMVRSPIDFSLPSPKQLQTLAQRSEELLNELHEAMNAPWTELFKFTIADPTKNPFEAADAMREPIFYGAESAYSFQYRDIAPKKYAYDDAWLRANKGFSSEEGRRVVVAILDFLNKKLYETVLGLKALPIEAWTLLPGFEFSRSDIATESGLPAEIINKFLVAFSVEGQGNPTFTSLHEFNSTNAYACSEEILSASLLFTDTAGKEIEIPKSIKVVHPICVVSDHYPALSFQARQFLSYKTTKGIKAPLVCDVFLLDTVTEMLDSPLRCLSYLELRAMVGDNIMLSHEHTALGYHLKQNLWLGEYDFMLLDDSVAADLDVAMAVRRDGVAGKRTPSGILTQLRDLSVGRLIDEIERRTDAGAIALGLELLKLSGDAVRDLSGAIDRIASAAEMDSKEHDATLLVGEGDSGITVHCNDLPDIIAAPKLQAHCQLRKYVSERPSGLVLSLHLVLLVFGLA